MGNNPNNPYDLNIHGFPATKLVGTDKKQLQDISYDGDWIPYVRDRIKKVEDLNRNISPDKTRMKIEDFLKRDQFLDSSINNGQPEQKRVVNKFKDPLPPYESFDNKFLQKNGVRRSFNYLSGIKRREWGFREKILQGYPEYKPFFPYQSQYIVGIVTAGSGVFSGIQSVSDPKLTNTEVYRSAEMGSNGFVTEGSMTPTGLCFIQDETGGLGIALGSDIRYIRHPVIHRPNYANPYIIYDDMHAGSIVVPKADYRQFLRVGDLVIIEVGTNFKYWHAVLGCEPRYWEELWVPDNMLVKKRFAGKKSSDAVYYVDDILSDVTFGKHISPRDRKDPKKRRPYVDNWGAYEFFGQNSKFKENFLLLQRDVPPRGILKSNETTYSNYPIQEDHPWSFGTPIPVNTGMPYIMMEQFIIDETERFSPIPLVISASQLRGFPNPKHWKTKIKGFNSPKDLGIIEPNLAWRQETADDPEKNPWISNRNLINSNGKPDDLRGSDFKGMLVQIKNVRFVLPPEKPQFRAKLSTEEPQDTTDDTFKNSLRYKILMLIFSEKTDLDIIRVIATQLGYVPPENTSRREFQSVISYKLRFIKSDTQQIQFIYTYILQWAQSRFFDYQRIYKQLVKFTDLIDFLVKDAERYLKPLLDSIPKSSLKDLKDELKSLYEQLNTGTPIDQIEIKISDTRYSRFSSVAEAELIIFSKHRIDADGFYFDYLPDTLKIWEFSNWDEALDAVLDIGSYILQTFVDSFTFPGFSAGVIYVYGVLTSGEDDEWDDEESGDRTNYLKYEFEVLESTFPKSLDKEDGGYWWANPNIPLTNARSHFKDHKRTTDSGFLGTGLGADETRDEFTQLISSNKLPEIDDRYVRDLGMMYSSSYSPFAEEWKPSTMVDGKLVENEFKPIPSFGSYFIGNRIYYVMDENNVVIPIRINSNTEIARYKMPIPTGTVNITGIAWQYSLGKHGLEWEREAYMMQIWPRFASDITKEQLRKGPDKPDNDGREPEPPFPPPPPPPPPTRLPDLTLDIGDNNPSRLDCESLRRYLDSLNKTKQNYIDGQNWPIIETIGETNIHQDPISGMKIGIPTDPIKAKELIDGMPDYPCKGMTIGQEQELIITSNSGVSKRFHFRVGPNGECICTAYQPGTRNDSSNNNLTNNLGSNVNENIGNRNLNNRIIL